MRAQARVRVPGWLKWALACMITVPSFVFVQLQLERVPPPVLDVNMLFVPPKGLVTSAATGFQNVMADAFWLGLLQYYGERVTLKDRHCVNLPEMFDLITDLDSRFYFAYWLGAWAIADNQQVPEALALLEKAERLNPTDWNYPYLQGFLEFLYRHDYTRAAACFHRAALVPGHSRFATSMEARMLETGGQDDLALTTWRSIAEKAPDGATRQIAERNVKRIVAERARHAESIFRKLRHLQQSAAGKAYMNRIGREHGGMAR